MPWWGWGLAALPGVAVLIWSAWMLSRLDRAATDADGKPPRESAWSYAIRKHPEKALWYACVLLLLFIVSFWGWVDEFAPTSEPQSTPADQQ